MFNRQFWKKANLPGLVAYSLATLILVISPAINPSIALGQLPALTSPSGIPPLPVGVERRGALESAGIHLDGRELFRIASPAVLNRNEPGSQIPVEIRAKQIEANLEQLIVEDSSSNEEVLDPSTLQVSIEPINGHPVLFVQDAALTEAKVLLTVTDADAQYAATSKVRLAERWQKILEQELREALELRRPEALQRQISTVVKVLIAIALMTLMFGAVWVVLSRRRHQLEQQRQKESTVIQASEAVPVEPASPETELSLIQGLRQHFSLQRRLQTVRFLQWLLFWTIALIWMLGIAYSLNVFPQTRQFSQKVIVVPIVVLVVWFLTGLTNRLTDFGIDQFIQGRKQDQSLTKANLQRIATIARVIKGLKMVLVYTVSILWLLQWLKFISGSLLTLGALLALAVSFAAQSLVKDLVNGFLILLEDQFRIGDNVKIGDLAGMVENLNLRVTQIRNDEGGLITLPNSLIAEVENRSRTWARSDFQIEVAYNTDVDRALAVVKETIDRMAADSEWRSVILDTHELLGVDRISHAGIVIRVWIKTMPLQQWSTARELRRRLKIAFDRHNIQIGIPQQLLLESRLGQSDALERLQTSHTQASAPNQ